jgi:hypothetical protein
MRQQLNDLPAGRVLFGLVLAVAVLAPGGCGKGGKPTGRVSGQVLYAGKPVTEGEVNFFSKERGVGAVAKIDSSGNYALPDPIETGEYKVYVTPPLPKTVDPKKGEAKKVSSPIPRKYRDAATSDLTYTVKEGPNDYKIELKD